ncbi:MAG: hypothetical protein ABJJ37_08495 [Roseibium sp.]
MTKRVIAIVLCFFFGVNLSQSGDSMCGENLSVLIEGKYRALNDDYYINKLPTHIQSILSNLTSNGSVECNEGIKIEYIPLISFLSESSEDYGKYVAPSIVIDEELLILRRLSDCTARGQTYDRENIEAWLTNDDDFENVPTAIRYIINKMPKNDRSDKYTTFINTYSLEVAAIVEDYLDNKLSDP